MRYTYPCELTPDDGGVSISFPDVPEALTCGDDRTEAVSMAQDALATALAGYVHQRWDIPAPSPATDGQELIPVPPVTAAKLALYTAMRTQDVTNVELAKRLDLSEAAVRKLLNPDHRSHIGQVEMALRAVGRTLVVEDRAA